IASSPTSRSGSQNNSERLSSNRTSTPACSDCPQQCWIVPNIPAKSLFQCPFLTRTSVPLRASYHSIRFTSESSRSGLAHSVSLVRPKTLDALPSWERTYPSYHRRAFHGVGDPFILSSSWYQ